MVQLYFSIIIPVFNRPGEVDELLTSLVEQTFKNFEVIIVEDGSTEKCDNIAEQYEGRLNINYYFKENTGPGLTRNFGANKANGNYLIFFDSDCIIPENYIKEASRFLNNSYVDAFGGPDMSDESFTNLQKAINYSMTSFLTTGGIRGGKRRLDKFYPRSFNMGISKEAFSKVEGFSSMRFGEDIDLSIRLIEANFKTALIENAYVYHKRRTSLKKFYKQVFNSGTARIALHKRHRGSMKMVHLLPACFFLANICLISLGILLNWLLVIPIALFVILTFFGSAIKNKSIKIGILSIPASFIQLFGYGIGFIFAWWNIIVLKKKDFHSFKKTFYK